MRYGYRYHDKDGVVQTGEIDAPSREEAFQSLHAKGVKPMQFWTIEERRSLGRWWLVIAGIALVWALNILFGYLMFITGNLVTDSLIFSAVIGIIGFLFYRRTHAYDDMAREIERNAAERKAKGL